MSDDMPELTDAELIRSLDDRRLRRKIRRGRMNRTEMKYCPLCGGEVKTIKMKPNGAYLAFDVRHENRGECYLLVGIIDFTLRPLGSR